MIRRPPRSTRTDTLFPYTTLFRSARFLVMPIVAIIRSILPPTSEGMRLAVVTHVNSTLDLSPKAYSAIWRSEEHTSELQSLMRISYAVFCLKKKKRCTAHDMTKVVIIEGDILNTQISQ